MDYFVEIRDENGAWKGVGVIQLAESHAGPGRDVRGREALEQALSKVGVFAPRGIDHVTWTRPIDGKWQNFTIREGGKNGEMIVRGDHTALLKRGIPAEPSKHPKFSDPRKSAIATLKNRLRRMEHRNVEYRYFEGDAHRVGSIVKISMNGNFEVRGPLGQLLTVTTSKARALDALASHIALSHPSGE